MNIAQNAKNEELENAKELVKNALILCEKQDFSKGIRNLLVAQKIFVKNKTSEYISICLSGLGFLYYLKDKKRYKTALDAIKEAKMLAEITKDAYAKAVNEFVIGHVEYLEKSYFTALSHYQNALNYSQKTDQTFLTKTIIAHIEEAKFAMSPHDEDKCDPLMALHKIAQSIAAETNIDTLLEVIAQETKEAIKADRCSVFLYDKEKNELWSKVALGLDSQEIRFPASKGLAGHVVKTGKTINIKDAYNDERFNKEIDLQTGYKTKTILCMPIKNLKQQIIGAFQVLNKLHGEFSTEDENLLVAIGSSAGISLENAQLFKQQQEMFIEQKRTFESFIDTLATSIDARDKITSGHSSRVKLYSGLISRELGLDEKNIEIIEKAAVLHDIGKIGIRDSVLQKEGKLTDDEYKHIQEHVQITHNILNKIHSSEDFKIITEIACSHHEKFDGNGYWRKLQGEDIHIGGRILAVSDVFDAITSKRHYRDKMPILNVINILMKDSGTHFDKNIVDCFLSIKTDKLVNVFLTENNLTLKEEDKSILAKYSLGDLFSLLTQTNPENLSEEHNTFINLFNFYYTAKSNQETHAQ